MKTLHLTGLLALVLCIGLTAKAQEAGSLTEEAILREAAENIEAHRKSEATVTLLDRDGNPVRKTPVEIRQTSQDFLFGALAFPLVREKITDPAREALFKERFTELFNLAILPFYWSAYEPTAGHPRWNNIEPVLSWCLENGITCKGHPLAWTHEVGLPDYVLEMSLEESELLLDSRIIENVTGFRDRITMWDVVNEPVNTVTWKMAHEDKTKEHRYRTDIPVADIADWVENAYKTAGYAVPKNTYILNEFMQIADTAIRKRFYDLTAELLDRGTPIHGLGIQAHEPRAEWYDPVDVWETLELYSEFGLPLHITEFTPRSDGAEITGGYRTGHWTPALQAEYVETMYRIWFGHPAVVSINWWGFSDADTWLPGGGFLDEDFNPKPAFHVLKRLIREEWTTSPILAETDRKGRISFKGFHGNYEVIVHQAGREPVITRFHLQQEGAGEWTIVLN